jgi:DNA-binding PadR family transcriptional regulator
MATDMTTRLIAAPPSRDVEREFLLAFWKVHILHHAAEEPVVGQWVMRELRRHGYEVSPGTLYPLLARMEGRGWLRCKADPDGGLRARKEYTLTREGRSVLAQLRRRVEELYREVVVGEEGPPPSAPAAGRGAGLRPATKRRGG